MKFEDKYFIKFNFNQEQIEKNLKNAIKDLDIAKKDKILAALSVNLQKRERGKVKYN